MKGAGRTAAALVFATIVVVALAPYWMAAMLIARAAERPAWLLPLARASARPVSDAIERIPLREGTARARLFRPGGAPASAVLLVGGVHPDGIDEPRLVRLAGELAATGLVVLTPEIDDLVHFRITSRVTDTIEDVASWMSTRPDLFGSTRIGVIGVSFSGGLSLVAAGRPSVRDRIAFVLSFGGHGNLPRVLRYLCTGEGSPETPHDYGLAVVLHQAAGRLVPPAQVEPLQSSVETFLFASALARAEPERADRMFAEVKQRQLELPEPAATLLTYVTNRDVAALGATLVPHLDELGQDPALSPDRSPPPAAPVYLLHGAGDNVIPAVESARIAAYLASRTRLLVTGFLTHVDVARRPSAGDIWQMVSFWKEMLGEID